MEPSENMFDAFNDEEEVVNKTVSTNEKFTGKKFKRNHNEEQVDLSNKKKQKTR
jgi:hypothetical protein